MPTGIEFSIGKALEWGKVHKLIGRKKTLDNSVSDRLIFKHGIMSEKAVTKRSTYCPLPERTAAEGR